MLPRLQPDPTQPLVDVQQTAFSYDLLGRYICNTWDEVQNNGGDPFDIVVIGAGMYGGYLAEKLYRFGEALGLRILVVDAGSVLASTHLQNLPHISVGVPDAGGIGAVTGNDRDPGPQNLVWGFPWHSNQPFPGLAYCLGGRSLFWGGWAPRLTDADLAQWPAEVTQDLQTTYPQVETEIGVQPTTDYISGPLYETLLAAFKKAAPADYVVAEAPLAVQGKANESGLFAFDKYSSAYLLIDAIREDTARRWRNNINAWRRFMLLPRTQVVRLRHNGTRVTAIECFVNGQFQVLAPPLLAPNCVVVLAASTIESTRLALESFPVAGMGANLMAHLRSNLTVRIKRSVFPSLPQTPTDLEAAALIVRGTTSTHHRFHLQVTAAAIQGSNPEAEMFTAIPDLDLLDQIRANQDPNWIVVTLRGLGELIGDKTARPGDQKKSWMDLTFPDPNQLDQFGKRRAWVNLEPSDDDNAAWDEMEQRAVDLVKALAGGKASNIQYWYNNTWNPVVPPPKTGRDLLGSTHHESGTLWMGDPGAAITNVFGRFHHLDNAYVAGPALFPTAGSANPSLTGMTLARRTAHAIIQQLTPAPSPTFKPLFTGTLTGWHMAGAGGFTVQGDVLRSFGGLGLLWYTHEEFGDFVLTLEWRVFAHEGNSGVFIRFPALNSSNPATDWQLAVNRGYEVQIDDSGYNPDTNQPNDPVRLTGAIYSFAAPSQLASNPIGQWNTYEITAQGGKLNVTLNGVHVITDFQVDTIRPRRGHIGLQNHSGVSGPSLVEFRNIQIKSL